MISQRISKERTKQHCKENVKVPILVVNMLVKSFESWIQKDTSEEKASLYIELKERGDDDKSCLLRTRGRSRNVHT